MKELITVVVPCYNVEQYIERCVNSIIGQTYKDLEIILVDDGSSDSTPKICDEFSQRDYRVKVIHKVNAGLSEARNSGIDVARGKFISFIDGDDYIEPKMYETLLSYFIDGVSLVGGGTIEKNGEKYRITDCPKETRNLMSEGEKVSVFLDNWNGFLGNSCCDKLFLTERAKRLRFVKGLYAEDLDFLFRYILEEGIAVCVNLAFYHYDKRPNSLTTSKVSKAYLTTRDTVSMIKERSMECFPELTDKAIYYELMWLNSMWIMIKEASNYNDLKTEYVEIRQSISEDYLRIGFERLWRMNKMFSVQTASIYSNTYSIFRFFFKLYVGIRK